MSRDFIIRTIFLDFIYPDHHATRVFCAPLAVGRPP
ncbi:MAG: hypothetical protein ACI88U_001473, partial [Porticoccaceae bacterium]